VRTRDEAARLCRNFLALRFRTRSHRFRNKSASLAALKSTRPGRVSVGAARGNKVQGNPWR
jgi:hypothetical protein